MHRVSDPEWWSWGYSEELLAELVELSDLGNRLYVQSHSKPGAKLPEPVRVPRPYGKDEPEEEPRRQATTAEIIAMFSGGSGKVVKS